jgi:dCMP deaminase
MTEQEKAKAKQKRHDNMYLHICNVIAHQSHACRAKVGALIVKDTNILSFGYNGTPAGFDNKCEETVEVNGQMTTRTKPIVLHAESNAFMKLAMNGGMGAKNATLYCTYSPCIECAKMIIQAGIKRVVYLRNYRSNEGLALLDEAGIEHEQFSQSYFAKNNSEDVNDIMFE